MGLCASTNMTPAEKAALAKAKLYSKGLDDEAREQNLAEAQIHKMLLLGAGESGKSTLFKQMVTLYGTGYSDADRAEFKDVIHNNVVVAMQKLIEEARIDPDLGPASVVSGMGFDDVINESNVEVFISLWQDPKVQAAYERRAEFQLHDSTRYFLERLQDIASVDYVPSEQDILRARVRTTGIVEKSFTIKENKFRMFDVGGQRNERNKWIHCFDNVTCVLFVASLNGYDQNLFEDESTNRLEEALNLFEEICNSRWFRETPCILFLNKRDLFEEKIKTVPLSACPLLPEFDEKVSFAQGCEVVEAKFRERNKNEEKWLFAHVTCATDTDMVGNVFNDVQDIVVRWSLREAGLV